MPASGPPPLSPPTDEHNPSTRALPSVAALASVIGGVAAVAAVASFAETTGLVLALPAQVTLLTAIPLLAMIAVQATASRPGYRPLGALFAGLSVGATWVAVFTIARLLDLPSSPLLLWPPVCIGLAVALSHGFVWLAPASVVGATIAVASISFVAAGAPWTTVFQRWEPTLMTATAWLVLGERLTGLVVAGIVAGVAGVLVLALGGRKLSPREIMASLVQPAALCGLGTGALFSLTGVMVKRATLHLTMPDPVAEALVTLLVVLLLQTAMLGGYVAGSAGGAGSSAAITPVSASSPFAFR